MEDVNESTLRMEEYKQLRSHIDSASKTQLQIFTFSIISSSAFIGFFIQAEKLNFDSLYFNVFLAPPLIYIPCSFLIKDIRDEIYRIGTYIHVFIEKENSYLYEGALSLIRDQNNSKESHDPVFTTYWLFTLICFGFNMDMDLYYRSNVITILTHIYSWAVVILFLSKAHGQFRMIPSNGRKNYIKQWKHVKKTIDTSSHST